jgi:hypothetical protein
LLDGRQGIRSFNKQHRTTALPCTLSLSSTRLSDGCWLKSCLRSIGMSSLVHV